MAPEPDANGPIVPLAVQHIGVAVKSLHRALDTYIGVFGFRKVSEVVDVASQNVRVCFVESANGTLVELVEGVGEGSPVDDILSRPGAGPYHLCYSVDDLDDTVRRLRKQGCFLVKRFEQAAYGHRRFAYLLSPDRQLFELCEPDRSVGGELALGEPMQYSFHTLYFEASRVCNLACSMCMASSNNRDLVRRLQKSQLTVDEIERHVLGPGRDIGIQTIIWSGGEFLLRPDSDEIVRRATDYGYASTVCTNAVRTDRERLLRLKEAAGGALVVALGINSIDDENSWTRDADCESTLEALELCRELGIRRHVVVNVGTHNLATLDRTLQWLDNQGIPYNRSPYTARGSGREHWDDLHFDKQQMESTIHPALRKHPIGYVSYTPFFLSPEVHERYSKGSSNVTVPQNPSIGCWCGSWLAMNAEGDVSPCGILLDDVDCGNVRDKTFQEILDHSPIFQQVLDRSLLKGKCGRCRYKHTCGGCRAMAYYEHGDIMAEDPTCFFEPEDESTVSEHETETNSMFRRYAFMARHASRALGGTVGEDDEKEADRLP